MVKNKEYTWIKNIYWKLDQYSCILVLRHKLWFKSAIKELKKIWLIIETERKTGFEHRAPKRKCNRQKKNNYLNTEPDPSQLNKCLINSSGNILDVDMGSCSKIEDTVDEITIKIITEPINSAVIY